ncbi:histidine kinase N-terminal 7TM domain-containing protein [Naasia aerilata]|uniref:Uncharacterized protein n=1 Tax=Naasia aerilata TaxID=1162966 RepID=A0ABM8G8E3_9MICO|nr:histidine kinase N-terminal 7TM domain-containing protein [Naasia aerilata]BDZ44409.1 hypothetical protein GCM10025866_03180 [Naasia aerilata]
MHPAVSRWPWAIPAGALLAVLVGSALAVAARVPEIGYLVVDAVVGVTYPAVGALIVARRPRHRVGWLFCIGGAGLALQALTGGYAALGEQEAWPGAELAGWVSNWIFFAGLGPLLFLPLLVPDGRLPSPRWRPVGVLIAVAIAVDLVLLMFRDVVWVWGRETPNPVGFVPTDTVMAPAFTVLIIVIAVAGVWALAARLRRPDPLVRRQLLPVLTAAVLLAAALVADGLLPSYSPVGTTLMAVALPLLPIGVAVSIFRYRLFDVEVYLRRTVVYALVTAILLAIYLGVVATFHTLLGTEGGVVVPLIGTAVVAVAFAPLRDLLQRAAARLLFGSRGDPAAALSTLGRRLEASADAGGLLDGAAETLARALRLPAVAIADADGVVVSAVGEPGPEAIRIPLRSGGRTEGSSQPRTGRRGNGSRTRTSPSCTRWAGTSRSRSRPAGCRARCSSPGRASSWPGRRSAASSAGSCTTAWAQDSRPSASGST